MSRHMYSVSVLEQLVERLKNLIGIKHVAHVCLSSVELQVCILHIQ